MQHNTDPATTRHGALAEEASVAAWARCHLLVPPGAWRRALAGTVKTDAGGRLVIYDPRNAVIFLPSAETACCPEAWRRATTRDWSGENTHSPGCPRG